MIDGKSITVRLATGFGGFMPSHSLAPVTAPRLGRDNNLINTQYKPGLKFTENNAKQKRKKYASTLDFKRT